MVKHYCNLLEHSAQFRLYWRKYYHKYHKTIYKEEPDHIEIPVPAGWRLERLGEEEFKIHFPDNYLEVAEKAEIASQIKLNQNSESFFSAKDKFEDEKSSKSDYLSIKDSFSGYINFPAPAEVEK